ELRRQRRRHLQRRHDDGLELLRTEQLRQHLAGRRHLQRRHARRADGQRQRLQRQQPGRHLRPVRRRGRQLLRLTPRGRHANVPSPASPRRTVCARGPVAHSPAQTTSGKERAMWFLPWRRMRTSNPAPRSRTPLRPAPFRPRLEALEGRDAPSTLTVTSSLDYGPGSLRYEIAQANTAATTVFNPKNSNHGTIPLLRGGLAVATSPA